MVSSRTTITTITRQCVAVIRGGQSVRAHPEINGDRIPVRAHAHARHPPIYPFSFLLVSPRAVSCSASHFFIFAHLKPSLLGALSYRGPCSRSFLRSLPFVAICKAKKRQKILRGYVRNQLEDQRGHRHLWPGIPLNGLSLASPFRNRSMELVSSPRLATFLSLYSSLLPFALLSFRSSHFSFLPPSLAFLHFSATGLSPFFPFNDLCFHENFIIRRVTLTEA